MSSKRPAFKLLVQSYNFRANPRLIIVYGHESESVDFMVESAREKEAKIIEICNKFHFTAEKKLQTTVIRTQIHRQGCLKKLKKALLKIEGVETISVGSKDYKMTVVGKVDSKKVLKELQKTGKYVELVSPAKEEQFVWKPESGYLSNSDAPRLYQSTFAGNETTEHPSLKKTMARLDREV